MPQISDNIIGVNFNEVVRPNKAIGRRFRTGTAVMGDDGKRYQYAKASAAITASNATVIITASGGEYTAAAGTGGTGTSPPVAMAAGDFGWIRLA